MKTLKNQFTRKGIHYNILERTKTRYFAELKSVDSGDLVIGYETGRIIQPKETVRTIGEVEVNFGEHIVGDEQFGRDQFERSMSPKSKDIIYTYFKKGISFDT